MVSVITPAFNAEAYIATTINSVIAQTYANWELIIVDDGSMDNTKAIIEGFSLNDNRIKVIKHKTPLGPAKARNRAIKEAKGKYIAFLDADDIWKPEKLEVQTNFMNTNNVQVCFSSYDLINEQGQPLLKRVEALPVIFYKKQLKCNYIGNLTGIYNAEVLGKIYMPEIPKRQDWVLWLKAIQKAGEARGIKDSLALYRVRSNSVSSNKIGLIKHNFNIYRKVLNFGLLKSLRYLFVFFNEYFFVKSKQIKKLPN